MAENSAISWTHATFNTWWGCLEVSPACDHCYAKAWAKRVGFSETGSKFPIWGKDASRRFFGEKHWAEPLKWDAAAEREGVRKRVFCGSMCDVMEDYNGDGHLVKESIEESRQWLYRLIERTPNLDWLLLTKRPQNFRRFLPKEWLKSPRPNVIGMTTVESADYLWRIDALVATPFAAYGLSLEPLFSHVTLPDSFLRLGKRGWTITGGESGAHARPGHPDWYRSLRDQSVASGVPFHFKQHGEWLSLADWDVFEHGSLTDKYEHQFVYRAGVKNDAELPISCYRIGKKAAGRLLNGREWNEVPTLEVAR